MPSVPRWTHVALPVRDVDRSIDWYAEFTPLKLISRRHDADGEAAWLGDPATVAAPMILVLVAMDATAHEPPTATLAPFAHLGVELPTRDAVDEVAARGALAGCLAWETADLPEPVGYICALTDPDGNMVEFSHGQRVEEIAHDVWRTGRVAGNGPRPA